MAIVSDVRGHGSGRPVVRHGQWYCPKHTVSLDIEDGGVEAGRNNEAATRTDKSSQHPQNAVGPKQRIISFRNI